VFESWKAPPCAASDVSPVSVFGSTRNMAQSFPIPVKASTMELPMTLYCSRGSQRPLHLRSAHACSRARRSANAAAAQAAAARPQKGEVFRDLAARRSGVANAQRTRAARRGLAVPSKAVVHPG
jgi:hypothetical protein